MLQIVVATHMATCRGEPVQILVVHTIIGVITTHTIAPTPVRTGATIAVVARVSKPMVDPHMVVAVMDIPLTSMVAMEVLLSENVVMTGVLLVRPLVILIARLASLHFINGSDLVLAIHIAPLVIMFKDQHEENTLSAHRTDIVELAMSIADSASVVLQNVTRVKIMLFWLMTQLLAKPVFLSATSVKLQAKPTAGSADISEPRSPVNLVFPVIDSVRQQRVQLISTSQSTVKITQLHRA